MAQNVDWHRFAECQWSETELFFPPKGGDTHAARRLCARCIVAEMCLEDALERREWYGVWGGTSERQRRRMLRERAA